MSLGTTLGLSRARDTFCEYVTGTADRTSTSCEAEESRACFRRRIGSVVEDSWGGPDAVASDATTATSEFDLACSKGSAEGLLGFDGDVESSSSVSCG